MFGLSGAVSKQVLVMRSKDRGPRRPEGDHRRLGSCRHRDLRHSPPGHS